MALTAVLVRLRPPNAGTQPSEAALIERGRPAPAIIGMTLDGASFDLAALRGRPVIVNFWGPSCIPCRDEFPLFTAKLAEHAGDAPAIVGILMHDPPAPARDFIAELGATWPTVDDPDGAIRTAYRVAARPQSYFIDRDGILRGIQVGELDEATFERQYALIAPTPVPSARSSAGSSARSSAGATGAPSGGGPGSSR